MNNKNKFLSGEISDKRIFLISCIESKTTSGQHTIGTAPFAPSISNHIIRYFFAIQMIPVLASFAFHDCSETIWESNVIFAERHFTFAVQWAL